MVDLMDPYWASLAVTVVLAFIVIVLAVRLLSMTSIGTGYFVVLVLLTLLLICILLMVSTVGHARDADERYAQSMLKPWFDTLRGGKGRCCSDANGYALADVDWESNSRKYRVRQRQTTNRH